MLTERIKVALYLIMYLLGFALSKTFAKPLVGVFIALAIVAAVYTMTQRDNVHWDSTKTIGRRKRYPVIGGYCVPQSRWSTTDGATTLEVIKCMLPVNDSKIVRQVKFARSSALPFDFIFFGKFFQTMAFIFTTVILIALLPFLSRFSSLFEMIMIITLLCFSPLFKVCISIFSTSCGKYLRIFKSRLFFISAEFIVRLDVIFPRLLFYFISIIKPIMVSIQMYAITTSATKSVRFLSIFCELVERLSLAAFATALREGIHSMSFLLCPKETCSQSGRTSAFSLIRLGYLPSIPQNKFHAIASGDM